MPHRPPDSPRLRLEVPDRVLAGEPVAILLRVENPTERPLQLYLTGKAIGFDIVVEREAGGRVWRRLEGVVMQSILRLETLAPGEALELMESWGQSSSSGVPVPPGEYLVRGELLTEGAPLTSPAARLRILPR